jgi:hypothetical protein
MRKVIVSKALIEAAVAAQQEWWKKEARYAENLDSDYSEGMKVALEAAIPLYLDTDEPGRWQYGVNWRSNFGGPFDRYQWFPTREEAIKEFEMVSGERGQFQDRGDGHGLNVRPCRRWIGRPFYEETFDELDECDGIPVAQFMLHDATSEQAEAIFDQVVDYIYEVAEEAGSNVDVTGSLNMGGMPKGRAVKDPSEVPLPGPGE